MDADVVVIGSGFGGSVAALRLAEKGYSVLVLEKGKRWRTEDFPRTNWNARKWLWLPASKCFGILQMSFLSDVIILSGIGVGGGSLVYANTLPVPPQAFFARRVAHRADWQPSSPALRDARRMLGATPNRRDARPDQVLAQIARDLGRASTFIRTPIAVYFGATAGARDAHARSVLRRRRPGAHRLHPLRRVHDRLPLRREEHARQELPVPRRAARRAVRAETEVGGAPAPEAAATRSRRPDRRVLAKRARTLRAARSSSPAACSARSSCSREQEDAGGLPRLSPRSATACAPTTRRSSASSRRPRDRTTRGVAITRRSTRPTSTHIEPVRYGAAPTRSRRSPRCPPTAAAASRAGCAPRARRPPPGAARARARPFGTARKSTPARHADAREHALAAPAPAVDAAVAARVDTRSPAGAAPELHPARQRGRARVRAEGRRRDAVGSSRRCSACRRPRTSSAARASADAPRARRHRRRHEVFGYPGLYVVDGAAVRRTWA